MRKREEMHLVKDGNAFYEVDEICMRNGLNKNVNEGNEQNYNWKKQQGKYPYRNRMK